MGGGVDDRFGLVFTALLARFVASPSQRAIFASEYLRISVVSFGRRDRGLSYQKKILTILES